MTDKQIITKSQMIMRIAELSAQLQTKHKECKDLRNDIKEIASLLDLDTGEEYNFGNIEMAIKDIKQECERLKKQAGCYSCGTCNGKEDYRHLEKHHIGLRKSFDECHKQLDQLKAKNEDLKKTNNHIEHNRNQKANKLIRIEKLIIACSTGYTDEFIQELLVILHEPEPSSFENKYKQTLTEIKEICNSVWGNGLDEEVDKFDLILRKISECEVEDER